MYGVRASLVAPKARAAWIHLVLDLDAPLCGDAVERRGPCRRVLGKRVPNGVLHAELRLAPKPADLAQDRGVGSAADGAGRHGEAARAALKRPRLFCVAEARLARGALGALRARVRVERPYDVDGRPAGNHPAVDPVPLRDVSRVERALPHHEHAVLEGPAHAGAVVVRVPQKVHLADSLGDLAAPKLVDEAAQYEVGEPRVSPGPRAGRAAACPAHRKHRAAPNLSPPRRGAAQSVL